MFQLPNPPAKDYALDCGAGIGRITKCLLTKHFDKVDLVEQSEKFLCAAQVEYLKDCSSHIGQYYRIGTCPPNSIWNFYKHFFLF